MKPPRRVELWLLLAVIVAGLIFVFASRHRDEDQAGFGSGVSSDDAPFRLDDWSLKFYRCVIERDYGNARLDIDLRVHYAGTDKLVLQPPKARLLAANGREIPPFFLPFEQLPEVPPNSTQDVQLRYWLEAADFQGVLKLEVDGSSVEVKSAKPFDLDTLKNAEKKTFTAGEW